METVGVLVIEKYYYVYKSRRNETAIILWKNTNNIYSHLYNIKDSNNPAESARRILFEQSCGLIYCTDHRQLSDPVLNTNITINVNLSTCYCIGINSGVLFGADYYKNKQILETGKLAPPDWKQTQGICRFYVSDLIQHNVYENGPLICPDTNGDQQTIDNLTKKIIGNALQNKIVTAVFKSPKDYTKIRHDTTDYLSGITSLLMLNY